VFAPSNLVFCTTANSSCNFKEFWLALTQDNAPHLLISTSELLTPLWAGWMDAASCSRWRYRINALAALAFCSCFSYCSQVPFQNQQLLLLCLQVVNKVVSSLYVVQLFPILFCTWSTTTAPFCHIDATLPLTSTPPTIIKVKNFLRSMFFGSQFSVSNLSYVWISLLQHLVISFLSDLKNSYYNPFLMFVNCVLIVSNFQIISRYQCFLFSFFKCVFCTF
jgi:hypothetical protein